MKPEQMSISQWHDYHIEAAGELPRIPYTPIAMRCENSQFIVGWKAGGFTMNGYSYTAFRPRADHGQCAMLAVREDFLKWVKNRLSAQKNLTRGTSNAKCNQPTLF